MTGEERRALIGLWSTPGVGAAAIAQLRGTLGALAELVDVPVRRWLDVSGLNDLAREGLRQLDTLGAHADRTLEAAERGEIGLCFPGEPAYPRGLAEIPDAPALLFFQGRGDRPNGPWRLAMVGSRHYESSLIETAEKLAMAVATRLIVVSGGARGIDQLCHRAALKAHAETWAFFGGGLDVLDASQAEVGGEILAGGGTLYSEFPPGVRALKIHFPRRNRLISGSSDAVLILRGGPNSGTLHTVQYAREQGRLLLAVPGQINHETSRTPNQLIRAGIARLVESAAEIFADMGLDATRSPPVEADAPAVDMTTLSANANRAFDALTRQGVDFDQLLLRSGPLNSGQLASALIELELAGLLVQRPGRRYERR